MRTAYLALAVVVLLAGCAGGLPGGDAQESTLQVYVSDDPGAIDQFDHLNVTITELSVRAATPRGEHDDSGHHRHRHHGNWTTYDLNATTADLAELRGANASLLHAVGVPEGEYTAVAVTVSDVNATLKSGESADVRVPGDRLRVQKSFTVGGNESTSFVVDAVVRERDDGYVLKPNLDASGAEVEVRHHGGCDCCHGGHHGGDATMREGGHSETDSHGDGCWHG